MQQDHDIAAEKDRNFVTALARGLELLAAFEPMETSLSHQILAARTGLPKATVTRLAYTLCKLGYLSMDPQGGYRLDSGVLSLGFSVLAGLDIGDRVEPELQKLAQGPNRYVACGLVERHRLEIIFLAAAQADQSILAARVGARLPLFLSAAGLAILTQSSDEIQQAALAELATAFPHKHDLAREALEQARQDMAREGFCRSYGVWRADVNGIAVPLRSLCGKRSFALNVGGPSFLVPQEQLEQDYLPLLQEATQRLNPDRRS